MANTLEKPKQLSVVNYLKWQQQMFKKSKAILIHAWMTDQEGKCMLTKAVLIADDNTMAQVKAETAKEKAIQEMINFLWDSLHPLDQSLISKERDEDDLQEMWKKIQAKCTPDTYSLDKLQETIISLQCDQGPLQFIETCKMHQERLHISEEGRKLRPMEDFLRFCVQKMPRNHGWEDFKLRFKANPATSWSELTVRVEEFLQMTGQSELKIAEDQGSNRSE